MVAKPESPEWWLDRLYKQLRDRRPFLKTWDDWFTGEHPAPAGYEKAEPLMQRVLETVGLNMCAIVTNASLERQFIEGFRIGGTGGDALAAELWAMYQSNNMDLTSSQVHQEKQALSAAYVLVDPNTPNRDGHPTVTGEHPEQAITEAYPGEPGRRVGLRVWADEIASTIEAQVLMDDGEVVAFSAPTRITANWGLSMRPKWERQDSGSGTTDLGACALVPFFNRPRMLKAPRPEFFPMIRSQKRINKTLLDRMAMQDQGAFKAMWATGLAIPRDPVTGEPVEPFQKAVDRMFINENPEGSFGQFEADDIKQMLEAVQADVIAAAIEVPTPPDQILGQLVNVAEGGLAIAQSSLVSRVHLHQRHDEESWEEVARLMLRGAGKDSPADASMETVWRAAEYRTDGERAQAGITAQAARVPDAVVWEKYFGATPPQVAKWAEANEEQARREASVGVKAVRDAAAGGS